MTHIRNFALWWLVRWSSEKSGQLQNESPAVTNMKLSMIHPAKTPQIRPLKCTIAASVGPLQDKVFISDRPQMFPFTLRRGDRAEQRWRMNGKGKKETFESVISRRHRVFHFIHCFLNWFDLSTLELCFIHSATLNYCKWARNDWFFIIRWQWTIRKTNVMIKSIRIWYMASTCCSPQPLCKRFHCFRGLYRTSAWVFFFPVQSSMAAMSLRVDEDSLAEPSKPYLKETT